VATGGGDITSTGTSLHSAVSSWRWHGLLCCC